MNNGNSQSNENTNQQLLQHSLSNIDQQPISSFSSPHLSNGSFSLAALLKEYGFKFKFKIFFNFYLFRIQGLQESSRALKEAFREHELIISEYVFYFI